MRIGFVGHLACCAIAEGKASEAAAKLPALRIVRRGKRGFVMKVSGE
jgi:hypothetical protein